MKLPSPFLALLILIGCSGGSDLAPALSGEQASRPATPTDAPPAAATATTASEGASITVGVTLDPTLSWQGYGTSSPELTTLQVADYYDPDGTKGITALLITEGAANCPACVVEAKDLATRLDGAWGQEGVRVVQLLVWDKNGDSATPTTAQQWKSEAAALWPVGADPAFTFHQAGDNPFPIQIVVDPRTLLVVARLDGYQAELPDVDALAAKNHP